jgi:hypothetical protein
MSTSNDKPISSLSYGIEPSDFAQQGLRSLQMAVDDTIERKRRLGQYWVVWDGEKPVKVNAENDPLAAE